MTAAASLVGCATENGKCRHTYLFSELGKVGRKDGGRDLRKCVHGGGGGVRNRVGIDAVCALGSTHCVFLGINVQ